MATAMSPSYYTTTTMVPVTTPNVGSRLGPQIHQYTQPSGPHYQQQYSQEPQIFERIVNVTRRSTIEETLQLPIRQFVSFKNLRHRNKLGQQWEYCEHVSISLKPEELERKVRAHEQSGNDLVNLFVSMGSNRQKHVRKFEEKLNHKEVDPANWKWDLQALGEVREKPRAPPQSFWAIFQRNATKSNIVVPQQARTPPVVAIHQPIPYSQQPIQIQHSDYSPQQPQVISVPTIPAPPPPQPIQRAPLALPAPPQQLAALAPAAPIYTSQPPTGSSHTPRPVQPAQSQPTPALQYQAYHSQTSHKNVQPRTQPQVQQTVLPTTSNGPHYSVRQLTTQSQGPIKTPYVRPLPGTLQQPPPQSLVRKQHQTPEIDVYQYQEQDQSPPRWSTAVPRGSSHRRFVEEDILSEDSHSSYGGSSSDTSITNYTLSPNQPSLSTSCSSQKFQSSSKHRSSQHSSPLLTTSSRPSYEQERLSHRKTHMSSPSHSTRTNRVEIDFQLGTAHGRHSKDQHYHSMPRSFAKHYEYESADEEIVRRPHHSRHTPRAPMPGAFNSTHEASSHSHHISYVHADRVPTGRF